jgi:hypothetical protein
VLIVAKVMTQMPSCAIRETVDNLDDGNSVAVCATHNTLVRTGCLFFETVRWRRRKPDSKAAGAMGSAALPSSPIRAVSPSGIGWLSKTAMKRLTSLAHPFPVRGGMPVPTFKV